MGAGPNWVGGDATHKSDAYTANDKEVVSNHRYLDDRHYPGRCWICAVAREDHHRD